MTKFYTITMPAGGGGKTTVTGNSGYYISVKKGKNTCLIDQDQSCSLTNVLVRHMARVNGLNYKEVMDSLDDDKYSVKAIYDGNDPTPLKVADHLYLITGYSQLPEYTDRANKSLGQSIKNWRERNKDWLEENFGYVLIDTHNDEIENPFLTTAINASDGVVAVMPVDDTVFDKIPLIEERLELLHTAFGGEAKRLVVVGNKFQNGATASTVANNLKLNLRTYATRTRKYVGYFTQRKFLEAFKVDGTPLTTASEKKHGQKASDKKFFEECWKLLIKFIRTNARKVTTNGKKKQ